MREMIVFVNRNNKIIVIESSDGCFYDFDEFEFVVHGDKIPTNLLEEDGYGISPYLDMKNAFKPLKFYKIKWWVDDLSNEYGDFYYDMIEELTEIDYLNQSDCKECGVETPVEKSVEESKESENINIKDCRDKNVFNVLCMSCDGINKKCSM